jgi:hypothetical protein
MKQIFSVLIITTIAFLFSCSKSDSPAPDPGPGTGSGTYTLNCNGAAIQFAANVAPIIQSSCAQPACHNAGSSNGPGALTNYAQIFAARVQVRAAVLSGSMPLNGSLSSAQRNSIICWIDAGAPNN